MVKEINILDILLILINTVMHFRIWKSRVLGILPDNPIYQEVSDLSQMVEELKPRNVD